MQNQSPINVLECKEYVTFLENCKISNATLVPDAIYHKHHIVPRSLGGDNSESNLVTLTIYQHIEAHQILYKHFNRKADLYAITMLMEIAKESKGSIKTWYEMKAKHRKYNISVLQLKELLEKHNGIKEYVAAELNIPSNVIWYYCKKYKLKTQTNDESIHSQRQKDHLHNLHQKKKLLRKFKPTKEQIEEAIKKNNGVIIDAARSFGISDKLLRNRCKELGLEVRKTFVVRRMTQTSLEWKTLWDTHHNKLKISKILNCDPSTVHYNLKKYNII